MSTFAWQQVGRMTLCGRGKPLFPDLPDLPGLYRLTLDDAWCYIGESSNLRHRLSEYRTPTTGVIQEHSLHLALKLARGADIEIFSEGDLSSKTALCALEEVAIEAARSEGRKVLNGGNAGTAYRLSLDIQFHEKQIAKLRSKLDALNAKE